MTPCCRRAELCTSSVARRLLAREENQNKHAQKFAIIRHQYVMDSLVRTRPMFEYGSQHCIGHKISCLRDIIAKINLNGFVQKKKTFRYFLTIINTAMNTLLIAYTYAIKAVKIFELISTKIAK